MRALAAVVLLLLVAGVARADELGEGLKAAEELLQAGEAERALESYRELLAAHPDDVRPRQRLAYALFRTRDEVEAPLLLLLEQLERFPDDEWSADLLQRVAGRAHDRGDPALARRGWRRLSELRPDSRDLAYSVALASYEIGDLDAARLTLRLLMDRHPEYENSYLLLATLELEDGRPAEAVDVYRELLARFPGHVRARILLGNVLLWDLREYDRAETEFSSALALAPAGGELAAEAAAGKAEAANQRDLGRRLRRRHASLGWILAGVVATWLAVLAVATVLTRRRLGTPPSLHS